MNIINCIIQYLSNNGYIIHYSKGLDNIFIHGTSIKIKVEKCDILITHYRLGTRLPYKLNINNPKCFDQLLGIVKQLYNELYERNH